MPEAGLSIPNGDFKSQNVFASSGFQMGLNVDFFWGKFGLGLYGGTNNNGTNYEDGLPPVGGLIISRSNQINRDTWKQLLVGLGPIVKLPISQKFDLELSSKFGFSKFAYPDYTEYVETGDPLNQAYIMYETRNQDVEQKLNAMLLSAAKLSFKPSQKIAISLGANYTHAKDVLHSYKYLDGSFNPEMSDDELIASFLEAPTVTEIRKCHFNTIGITLGIGILIGGDKDKSKEDEKMEPPIPDYPEDGSTITPQEADSLTLVWLKENPNVDKANYNLWLYQVADSTRKHDSLIYQTKIERSLKFLLPKNIKLQTDSTYRWKVQAVDDKRLKPCPEACNSIDATFKISNTLQFQYYHLSTQNSGNYIEMRNQLRILLPKYIETGGVVQATIFNQRDEPVLTIDSLSRGVQRENYQSDAEGRVTIDLKRLEAGYYLLEVKNERKKTYYLRFRNTKTNEPIKD